MSCQNRVTYLKSVLYMLCVCVCVSEVSRAPKIFCIYHTCPTPSAAAVIAYEKRLRGTSPQATIGISWGKDLLIISERRRYAVSALLQLEKGRE